MKTVVSTKNAPGAIGPYSQATICNGVVYVSGQIPLDPVSGEISQGDITEQTTRVLNNIKAIVEAAGSDMSKALKATVLLTDMGDFATMNEAYKKFFPENPPARMCYEVSALPRGAAVEIDLFCAL